MFRARLIYRSRNGTTPLKGEHRLARSARLSGARGCTGAHKAAAPSTPTPGVGAGRPASACGRDPHPRARAGLPALTTATPGAGRPARAHYLSPGPLRPAQGSCTSGALRPPSPLRPSRRKREGSRASVFTGARCAGTYYMGRLGGRSGTRGSAGHPLSGQRARAIADHGWPVLLGLEAPWGRTAAV